MKVNLKLFLSKNQKKWNCRGFDALHYVEQVSRFSGNFSYHNANEKFGISKRKRRPGALKKLCRVGPSFPVWMPKTARFKPCYAFYNNNPSVVGWMTQYRGYHKIGMNSLSVGSWYHHFSPTEMSRYRNVGGRLNFINSTRNICALGAVLLFRGVTRIGVSCGFGFLPEYKSAFRPYSRLTSYRFHAIRAFNYETAYGEDLKWFEEKYEKYLKSG